MVVAVASVGACEEDTERPAPAGDCNDPACIEARNGVPVSIVGAGTDIGGEAGAGGGSGMPGPGAGTLAGTVLELTAADLQTRQNLSASVQVWAPRAGGPASNPVVDLVGTGGAFRLEGVLGSSVTWVGTGNYETPASEPYMQTLQAVDATKDEFVNLLVARRQVVRDSVTVAFMGEGIEFDPTLAHLAVRFVRSNGVALPDVHISVPPATQVPTAYDAGDIFTSAIDATSERGMALLVNMPAAPYPGITTSVVAELDDQQFSAQVQIVSGALTVVSAVVPDEP